MVPGRKRPCLSDAELDGELGGALAGFWIVASAPVGVPQAAQNRAMSDSSASQEEQRMGA